MFESTHLEMPYDELMVCYKNLELPSSFPLSSFFPQNATTVGASGMTL